MKGTIVDMNQCLLIRILVEEEIKRTKDPERLIECKGLRDYIRSSLGEMTVS